MAAERRERVSYLMILTFDGAAGGGGDVDVDALTQSVFDAYRG